MSKTGMTAKGSVKLETHKLRIDGEEVTVVILAKEYWLALAEAGSAACGPPPVEASDFEDVTPEDIIGDGIRDRDWSERRDREKRAWHLHVGFFGEPCGGCRGWVYADTEEGAADEAITEYLAHYELEQERQVSFPWDFENDYGRLVYCIHDRGEQCDSGCEKIQVIRMN